uniref:ATP-dependent DNA helicase n=1 Tax=Amphimedon queenslandica TaxID=400682 RepID=A0A1X7USH7_AMPQE
MKTLSDAKDFGPKNLPDPEYIILNGKPTKNNKIWHTLVDIKRVQAAYEKLKDINWLYRKLDDESLDKVAANSGTSTMIEEATKEDILGFNSYTIQNMNSNLNKGSDIQQYKMQNIKQIKELKGSIFKLLNTVTGPPMTAAQFVDQVKTNAEFLEKRLCTMINTVRGSKQYWYLRRSEVKHMIAEFGSPTFFLTFSCAEYYSQDIREYLHKGQVLGQVTEYYYKKEYQARGAPHCHCLIWIANAPDVGESRAEDVIRFIDERITCHIPNKDTCPELHKVVTRYQLHKCSNYFSENTVLNNVQQSMKAEKRIHYLKRSEEEARVNDYNPLLLLLWKANINVSFTSECSLALADYMSGYVTKAEGGHMLDLWQDILDDGGLYSKLFRIGIRCLDSQSIGLYKTCDILLGEPLCRKSRDVKWIDVDMPNKRTRNVTMKLNEVEEIAVNELSTEDFYGKGLPNSLTMAKIKMANDAIENYRRRTSLILRILINEDELVHDGESVPEAFDHHIVDNERYLEANEKFRKLLKCRETLKHIQDARAANREEDKYNVKDNDPQLMGQIKDAMRDMDTGSHLTLQKRESMLNKDQKRIFDHIKAHLLRQIEYEKKSKQEKEQSECVTHLHMFMSVVGGTGKFFLIEAIKALVKSLWSTLTKQRCAVAAPTGLAAYNVGGVMAHRQFQLPIEHKGQCLILVTTQD